jgi:signal transduction histidine kinase
MTGSSNPAPPPQPGLSLAAAILTCCLAGYAVVASLLRRSQLAGVWIKAADAAAVAVALAVLVLLWLTWRAGARRRDELTRLELRAGQQDAKLTEQAEQITGQARRLDAYEERLAQARAREQRLVDEQSVLHTRLDQSRADQQTRAVQEAALRQALDHTVAQRMPAAFEGRDVPSTDLPDNFDGELTKLLDQLVTGAAQAGDRSESVRSAVVALSRRVQTAAHRIQEEATLMAERHPGDTDVLDVSMRVDHAAAQQARHAQSMAVLCGEWPGQQWSEPLPLVDVVRAAAGRIIAYRRIEVAGDPDIAASAPVVEPLIHLVAELLANATQSSPPATSVPVTIRAVQRGAVIEVHDCGVGLDDHRLTLAREIASGTRLIGLEELGEVPQTGLAVVGQYVRRHGLRVDLSESVYGGVRTVVGIPNDLVETVAPAEALTVPPRSAPAPVEESASLVEDDRRPLARRHSPRHGNAAPATAAARETMVGPAADDAGADSPGADISDTDGTGADISDADGTGADSTGADSTGADSTGPDSADPAEPLSPEQAGAWMNAFLSADSGASDRADERDNSIEQEL